MIIPTYNCDRYITQAVESVLGQTYTDCEIIVVDDGSTDNTRKVLEPYLEQIRYVYQENQGVAAARNRGMEMAQGEFIAFLDHDDFFLPHKLALQVACFEEQPEVGMVHSGWRRVNHAGEPIRDVEPWHKVPNLDLQGWLQWMPILLSAMMFRREWLERVGSLDTGFKQACDVDLVQRLALMGCQTAWVHQITVGYREHERNDSLNTPLQAQESWAVRNKFFAQLDLPEEVRHLENSCRYHTLVWIAWRLYHTGYMAEMVDYLEKSFLYRTSSPTETVLSWIECFKTYASEYGCELDTYSLSNSQEWKGLMSRCIL